MYPTYTRNVPTCSKKNIFKYIQDISKISTINTKHQAAAGPTRAKPGAARSRSGPCVAPTDAAADAAKAQLVLM